MAIFLMIHGAWHGGWTFEALRAGLEAQGHRLINPDLPGIGGEPGWSTRTGLADWADFVADLARVQPEPVLLCGHSRGGVVISEAAERAPEAIAALVYITAFLVPDGRSLADMAVPRIPAFAEGLTIVDGGGATIVSPDAARAAFYDRSPEALASAAAARLVPEPTATRNAALSLTADRYGRIPRHYIECSEDRMIPLANQRSMQAALGVDTVATLESDHSPFLCCPDALVEELLRIARS